MERRCSSHEAPPPPSKWDTMLDGNIEKRWLRFKTVLLDLVEKYWPLARTGTDGRYCWGLLVPQCMGLTRGGGIRWIGLGEGWVGSPHR